MLHLAKRSVVNSDRAMRRMIGSSSLDLKPLLSFFNSSTSENMAGIPVVECIFHKGTSTCTYVVMDPATKDAAVIDSVLDFTYSAAKTSTEHIDAIVKVVKEQGANVKYILETHVHADHLSGAKELRKALGLDKVPICIGFNIGAVQHQFKVQISIFQPTSIPSQTINSLIYTPKLHRCQVLTA